MKKYILLCSFIFASLMFFSCNEDKHNATSPNENNAQAGRLSDNNKWEGNLPPATVKLISPKSKKNSINQLGDPPSLTPAEFNATLSPGETVCEEKNLHLPQNTTPAMGDILFCFDLTGSMGGELNNVKVNSINIMTAISGIISDSWFGVISHMDYPDTYNSCGYFASYGQPGIDYPYSMDQAITNNQTDVSNAINALVLGWGNDGPEDYTRAIHETWNDPSISFRAAAKKFVIMFLDNVPHDCAYDAVLGGGTTTGVDPGRDAVAGTGDDLAIQTELVQLSLQGITPIVLYSGGDAFGLSLWTAYTALAGGSTFPINPDGTIPGGTDIATFIAGLIQGSIQHFNEIKLEVCEPAYSGWVTVNPASYTDIDLDEDKDFSFEVCFTVPEGTEPGTYCFEVCAFGDGALLARQRVCIEVTTAKLDIKPTSCPNPLQTNNRGTLPAALLGTPDFDVRKVDVSTLKLEGVSPTRYTYEDVAAPFDDIPVDCYDCTTAGRDGYTDLTLKFDTQAIVAALGSYTDRECRVLRLTGNFKAEYGGGSFSAKDVVRIQTR